MGAKGMTSATGAFFDDLARRGYEPSLANEQGRLRFELVDGLCTQHWMVTVDDGDVAVSREEADADGVFRADLALFDRAARGEENPMTAMLRGEVSVDGNLELILQVIRLLPGPPHEQAGEGAASAGRRPG